MDNMQKTAVKNVLLGAAHYIREDGWARNVFINSNGCLCLEAALARAAGYDKGVILSAPWPGYNDPILAEAEETLGKYLESRHEIWKTSIPSRRFTQIASWNDNFAESAEEVITALECAAETLDV